MPSDFTRATAGSHKPAATKAPPPLTTAGRAARPAVAGTLWGELVLGAGAVTPEVLAHEMAHVLQTERFGARGARDSVTTPEAPDEREAQELAPRILRGNRVEATQPPTAALQLWSPTDAPILPHAEELRDATREGDADKVIDILASYHSAGQMAALRDNYGPGLVRDITRAFPAGGTKTLWSLARTYLGDHLTVAEKIFIDHAVFGLEAERIMAEIHGLSDKQALRIVLSEDGLPSLLDSSEDLGPKTTLSDVRAALAGALDDRQLYEAMNLLFLKAGRANLGQWTAQGTWPVDEASPPGLITLTVPTAPGRLSPFWNEPEDFLEVPPAGPDVDLDQAGSPLLMDPVARHRINLALEQVVAADETTEGRVFKDPAPRLGRAMIAIGVLTVTERRVLWARLAARSWVGFKQDQVERLHRLALYPDDATVLERAVIEADKEPYGYEPEMAMAARAAQAMIDDARNEAAQTADPHRKADLEQRAEHATSVFGSLAFQSAIGAYPGTEGQLAGLGADQLQVARQQLRRVDSVGALFALIESLPPGRRLHAGFSWEVTMRAERIGLDAGEQATLDAYMNFGSTPDDLNRIVLYQVKSAFADEEPARALGILHRLTPEQRAQFVGWAPYLEWYKKLIWAGDDGRSMYIYLTEVNEGRTQQALEKAAMFVSWMTPNAAPVIKDKNAYTELLNTRKERQPDRRRGFVLWSRLREDPKLELTDEERRLVDEYSEHRRLTDDFGWAERERVDEVYFGQPQLMTTAEREVDPTAEADYMFLRIAGRRKLKTTWKTVTDDVRAWRGEYLGPAVTEFLLTYGELRAAGMNKARLVILGDLYHRAMRETDEIKREQDMASLVASIVGAVVAVAVVTVLSGGTMSGPAIAAVAALAGGAAAATAGALIRPESTGWEVLRDFGTGAVEGAMAVAGSALAARVVRLVGLGAGVEAGAAAANAVELSTGARAAAGVVNAVVDGAVGGAAGEVFRTATDEATWDRSISEALARVLGSIARGAAQGAAGGFVVSAGLAAGGGLLRVASRLGQSTAVRAADMLESSGMSLARFSELSEAGQDALVAAERLAAQGDIDGALKLIGTVEALTADEVARVAGTLRSVRVAEAVLETGLDRAEVLRRLEVVEPAEFARRTSNARGNAVLEFEKDGPRILMRADVDPLVVREEIVHLRQWLNDPMMRARMERIGALKPEAWASLKPHERAPLVIDKLEVEADAQRRIIANLEQRAAAGDVAAADQIAAAEDTMRLIGKRLDEVEGAVATGTVGKLDLETQPRLFSKEAPSRGADPAKAKNWSKVQSKGVLDKDPATVEAELRELGYTPVKNKSDGRIWKINRPHGGAKADDFAFLQIVETEAGPRVAPGQQRLTFAERRNLAAQTFRRRTKDVAQMQAELASGKLAAAQRKVLREALEDASPEFLGELQRAVASGKLDEGSAGLLSSWGPMVQALKKRGRGYAELLGPVTGHQGPLTKDVYDEFRRALRQVAAEDLAAIPLPRARRAALDDMLDLQPDSKSKGELFSAYLRIGRAPAGERHVLDVPFGPPGGRHPDDVNFGSDLSRELPPGTFAVEHKAGPGAFKIDQAEDYARSFSAPGGPVTTAGAPAGWDGVVYVFSARSEAQTALGQMQRSATIRPLLDRPQNGIHLLYVDEAGFLRPFRAGGGVAP